MAGSLLDSKTNENFAAELAARRRSPRRMFGTVDLVLLGGGVDFFALIDRFGPQKALAERVDAGRASA